MFIDELVTRFWSYKARAFAEHSHLFEENSPRGRRPPVFRRSASTHNVLLHPDLGNQQRLQVLASIPAWKRHRWFRSMKSSQALVQSVFGNLKVLGKIGLLANVRTHQNDRLGDLFGTDSPATCDLEHSIDHLGEIPGRTTEVDAFFLGPRRVAMEAKLSENAIGACSRPGLDAADPHHCNGTYSLQSTRKTRCSLSEIGIRYWEHIPELFAWSAESDHCPCPIFSSYQLVRNVLAACVKPDGTMSAADGTAILLVDVRNPAFQAGGAGNIAFEQVRTALRNPRMLQCCSWQNILASLRTDETLAGLTQQIEDKYGF